MGALFLGWAGVTLSCPRAGSLSPPGLCSLPFSPAPAAAPGWQVAGPFTRAPPALGDLPSPWLAQEVQNLEANLVQGLGKTLACTVFIAGDYEEGEFSTLIF